MFPYSSGKKIWYFGIRCFGGIKEALLVVEVRPPALPSLLFVEPLEEEPLRLLVALFFLLFFLFLLFMLLEKISNWQGIPRLHYMHLSNKTSLPSYELIA